MVRLLALFSLLTILQLAATGDKGMGVDPNGGVVRSLAGDEGVGIDPNGGGAMDPNGSSDIGAGIDPNGARLCYSACLDPNG